MRQRHSLVSSFQLSTHAFLAILIAIIALGNCLFSPTLHAQTAGASDRVILRGNTHPLANRANRVAPADRNFRMEKMVLLLARRAGTQSQLDALIAQQHDPSSALYHRWLTPEEFGRRFGASDADLATVANWLHSQGFSIDEVARGRGWINFSGDVDQVERAFQTEIAEYRVNGKLHRANSSDPSIPRALTNIVRGVVTLHDFRKQPSQANVTRLNDKAPDFTLGSGHFLAPADFATIYNVNPLYYSSIDGTGQSIAIVGRSAINLADVQYFRSYFGLPYRDPELILNGPDPGELGGSEEIEADLDVQWAGAVAPNALIRFVRSKSTSSTDGVDLSAQYIVDHNIAPVMSTSFGACESALGTTENAFYNNLWAQAAAQGITSFVSSGDSGVAGCQVGNNTSGSGLAVSGLSSTPYNVCVGGTQFADTSNPGLYWSSTNNSGNKGSAYSYIPEVVWNESGAVGGGSGLWASGGGASSLYPKPAWQAAPGVPADGHRDVPDVSLTAAGHDGYIVVLNGGLYSVGGTSASSPSFAGLMALVAQAKGGARQGNANVVFYSLARKQYAGGGAPVYHDTTVGNNSVPGVTGYAAGFGYDQATGLGSFDALALVNNWTSEFSLSTSRTAISIPAGSSNTVTITTDVGGGFNSAISLSAVGQPAGVTVGFAPVSIAAPGSGSSTMTITLDPTAPVGVYPITVIGAGGSQTQTSTVTLTVLQPTSVGALDVGSSSTNTMTLLFKSAGTLDTINVLTQGAPNLDFQLAPGGTCSIGTAYAVNNTCTVNVTFAPRYPGLRMGAVVLKGATGATLANGYVQGIGNSPLLSFSPAAQTVISPTGMNLPMGLAMDAPGNLYFGNLGTNTLIKVFGDGSGQTNVGTGLNSPSGAAVDGAGNVYITNQQAKLVKVTPGGEQTPVGSVSFETGVAVDGSGNIYECGINGLVKVPVDGSGETRLGTGFWSPYGVAVDAAGNVYVADYQNNRAVKVAADGSGQTELGTGLRYPYGVAVDAAGSVYVADYGNDRVVKVPADGSAQTVVAANLNGPVGVALDGAGNVYTVTRFATLHIVKVRQADAPSLSFPSMQVGSISAVQQVTLSNAGNEPLAFSSLSVSANFNIDSSTTTCSTSSPLPAGSSCVLGIVFTPTTWGSISGSVTITHDGLNVSGSVQQLQLSGTATRQTPTITWASPAWITYGTPLSGTQLNATASVPGTFVYTPAAGTVLAAGTQTLSVTFTPDNTTYYNTASKTVSLSVHKATPTITWATPAAITYGTPLSGTQLNATASVPGTFVYTPAAGTVLPSGPQAQVLSVTFMPSDTANYTTASSAVWLLVYKATPTITWATPAAITYGTALSGTQLNATASVPGTFVYDPAAGTVLWPGTQTLAVTFMPTDTANYTNTSKTVSLTVNKATPTITWAAPAAITYGTALSGEQLKAMASAYGTFVYSPAAGTVLVAGAQTLSVTFTPTDTANYATATASVSLTVNKATPAIAWATPAAITYGTPLSGAQLNATASVPGTFVYSPSAGTVLAPGEQTLLVTFAPTDTADYDTANAAVLVTVLPPSSSLSLGTVAVGSSSGQTVTLVVQAAGTLNSIGVVTQGAPNMDFQQAQGGTCAPGVSYLAGDVCTVNVTFAPKYPGLRMGAVVLKDASGATLATEYLQGVGSGPLPSFTPGVQTTLPAAGLWDPYATAMDGAGNIFIGDVNNSRVVKLSPDGTQTTIASGVYPAALAVDGPGNLYVATGGGPIVKIAAGSGAQTTLGPWYWLGYYVEPVGIAVDGAGNLYLGDVNYQAVMKLTPDGALSVLSPDRWPAPNSFYMPVGLALDGGGNVYVSDFAGRVARLSADGTAQTTVPATGLWDPWGVAVNAAGDVYIADYINNRTVKVPADGTQQTTVGSGSSAARGVALDGAGNVYISDGGNNRVLKVSAAAAPLNFATTNVGSTSATKAVTISNAGNGPLAFSSIAVSGHFAVDSGTTTCSISAPLAVGASCTVGVVFTPTAAGSATGVLTITDNALNASGATQPVQLSGDGVALTSIAVSPSSATLNVGETLQFTATGTYSNGAVQDLTSTANWVSSNSAVADISGSGMASALTVGNAKISATYGGVTSSLVSLAVQLKVALAPTFLPASGTFTAGQMVTLSTPSTGAAIYYTTNGSTPTATSGTLYTGPITLSSNTTIKAIAAGGSYAASSVASGTYNVVAVAPTFSPAPGVFNAAQQVMLSTASSGAAIYYTTNGTTPTVATGTLYTAPINVTSAMTIKAIASGVNYVSSPTATGNYSIVAVAPTMSPAPGTYTGGQSVTLATPSGVSIYYTTNGSTPTVSTGTPYTGPITVSASTTIKAIAVGTAGGTSYSASSTASGSYSIVAVAPTFSPAPGTYTDSQSVTLTSPSGVSIYYTTNGSTPTVSTGTPYTAPITVSSSTTIKAIAAGTAADGTTYAASGTASGLYNIVAVAPAMSPAPGVFNAAQPVTLTTSSPGAAIYYTINGTTPTVSTGTLYTGPITVSASTTIKAIAAGARFASSSMTSGNYSIVAVAPTMSPAPGTYTGGQTVTLTTPSGVAIYYTMNGTTPTVSTGTLYTGPITVSSSTTIKAIAAGSAGGTTYATSSTASGAYSIVAVAPTFSPAPGVFNGAQQVTLTTSSPGTAIYYTTNGTTPTASTGTLYSVPITVSSSTTIKAIAVGGSYASSTMSSGMYTIAAVAPTFSPAPGVFNAAQLVTLSTSSGVSIYYTTNGSTPTVSTGTLYTGPINVSASTTIKAIAAGAANGTTYAASSSASGAYNIVAVAPTMSPAPGTYTSGQSVTLTTSSGVSIYYTTNGTTPTVSTGTLYTGPITVGSSTTIKAIAAGSAGGTTYAASSTASGMYNIVAVAPSFSPAAGTYTGMQTVTLTTSTPNASIYYTTNGTTPTASTGTLYTGPITVASSTTIKAIATSGGYGSSTAASATYTIK